MYRDLVFRPGVDSYSTRDLVFRPGVDTTIVETLPYEYERAGRTPGIVPDRSGPGIEERVTYAETPDLSGLVRASEDATRKAQLYLDLFMRGMGTGPLAALPEPMSQEDFAEIVNRRIDDRGPSVQERLRRLGANSLQEAFQKGILPRPPRLPGV